MSSSPIPPDAIIRAGIESDPELKARTGRILSRLLDELEDMLGPHGAPPKIQQDLVKAAIPAMFRELREQQQGDDLTALRGEVQELMGSIRGIARSELPAADNQGDMPVDGA